MPSTLESRKSVKTKNTAERPSPMTISPSVATSQARNSGSSKMPVRRLLKVKTTFEAWMVIARGVEAARKRADHFKGKKVFERILAQQGIGEVLGNNPATVKSTATRLLKILKHETEVIAWRSKLSDWSVYNGQARQPSISTARFFSIRPSATARRRRRSRSLHRRSG